MRSLSFAGAGAVVLMAALPAVAQSPSATGGARSEVLEEIIVTAQRRPEKLQHVPVAESVVSGSTLEALEINNPTNLAALVPALQFSDSNTSRGLGFAIRGVGTTTFGDGVEQSVGTVIDGVVMGRPGQGIGDLADVDQVEVLRGPQGMLFGKNASAGLIVITTHRPEIDDLSLRLRLTAGQHGEQRYQLIGNIPLGSRAALRVVGYSNKRDGLVHDYAKNLDYNGRDEKGARASLLFNATEDLQFMLRADYSDRDAPCCMWTTRSVTPGGYMALTQPPQVIAGPDNLGVKLSGDVFSHTISKGGSLQGDWNLRDYTLTSITAYRKWLEADANDADQSVLPIFDLNYGDNDVSQFSQELRLASPEHDRFNWVSGLYWYDLRLTGHYDQGGTLGYPLPPGYRLATHNMNDIQTTSFGAFGQANFDITERLRVFAGARYTREHYSLDYVRRGGTPPFEFTYIPPTAFTTSDGASNWSWRTGVQYFPVPSMNLYFSVARGFKGRAILTDAAVTASNTFVPPEIPTAYELGLKKTWLDGALITDLALFRTNFDDFQAQIFDTTVTPNIFRVTSAGRVVTQGVELDFRAVPAAGLTLGGGLAYTDAFIDSTYRIPCYKNQTAAEGCEIATGQFDAHGQRLANTPEWKLSLYGRYQRPLTGRLDGFGQMDLNRRSSVNFSMNADPHTVQEGYSVVGAAIGVAGSEDRWRLSLYVRNLFDRQFVSVIFPTPFDSGGYSQFPNPEAYRTVGVTLETRF